MLLVPSLQRYFCVIKKEIAMVQQNITLHQLPVNVLEPLKIKNNSLLKRKDSEEKTCKHRNENGWCSKSQRQCLLLINLFSEL